MPGGSKIIRVHILVSGLVQGVYFRAGTRDKAVSLGLSGWVKNTGDGRVEIVAEGPEEKIGVLTQWCHKGPAGAEVTGVNVTEETPAGEFSGFRITYY